MSKKSRAAKNRKKNRFKDPGKPAKSGEKWQTGGLLYPPGHKARRIRRAREEEKEWAAKAGPVTTRFAGESGEEKEGNT